MKHELMEVLDNAAVDVPLENKYGETLPKLRYNFSEFLLSINHPKADIFKTVKPIRLKMPWRTERNSVDCGVFVMRHMETYHGGGVKNWKNTSLVREGQQQTKQLNSLRKKYLVAMLKWTKNERRQYILDISNKSMRAELQKRMTNQA